MSANESGLIPGYETIVITRAELSDDALKTLQERIISISKEYKGDLVLQEDWGKRKLAYPIQKETRGQYSYLVYTGTGSVVHEVERNLRIHEHVLRFMTVALEPEFKEEEFKKKRAEAHAAAKRREEEREARREERANRSSYYEDRRDRYEEPSAQQFDGGSEE